MQRLKNNDFVDLYIGQDYAEIKGLTGADKILVSVPGHLIEDCKILSERCLSFYRDSGRTEFSLLHDLRLYRVTVTLDLFGAENFVIRQTPDGVRNLKDIPLSTKLRTSIDQKNATGLVLIAGAMGSGKTTTAAAILKRRIEVTADLGVSIEDPAETLLKGRHGEGRCMQLEVSGNETYASATKKAFRMGASSFLLGEIRDGVTAHEVLKASLSMFVVSTIHAASIQEAIERYVMFCEELNPGAKANVASTLYIVAHQVMTTIVRDEKVFSRNVEITGFDLRNSESADTIKAKISAGNYSALRDDLRSNMNKF